MFFLYFRIEKFSLDDKLQVNMSPIGGASIGAATTSTADQASNENNNEDNAAWSPSRKQPIEYITVGEILDKYNTRGVMLKVNVYGVITYLPSIEKKGNLKIAIFEKIFSYQDFCMVS